MVESTTGLQAVADTAASSDCWLAALPCALTQAQQQVMRKAFALAQAAYGDADMGYAQQVATVVAQMGLDAEAVVAALLYGLPRRPGFARPQVAEQLGDDVLALVEGVSRVDALGVERQSARGDSNTQFEALRKMILAMARDIRVVCIALAMRVVELHQLPYETNAFGQELAWQTLALYAPLANRLGIARLKWELEDLSLRLLEPQSYHTIARSLAATRRGRERDIRQLQARLSETLTAAGIKAEVSGRPKHIYSIWRKMQSKNLEFTRLFDIRAFRVLVETVADCYAALAAVHELWSPITAEYSDYIAAPKANNYQSLHTVVSGPDGRSIEVQLRTYAMHQQAEFGVAAHWRYKEGGPQDKTADERIAWFRELLQWAQTEAGTQGLLQQYQTQLFEDRVYVLTPQGDVIDLPRGATPLEFAYRIHSQVGHHCRGATVNGKMVPLTHVLHTGDQVAVQTARNAEPSRDWLNPRQGYLVSTRARARVQQWFRQRDYDRNMADGRRLLERALRRQGRLASVKFEPLAQQTRFPKVDDFLAAVGRGDLTLAQVEHLLPRSHPRPPTAQSPAQSTPEQASLPPADDRPAPIIVGGMDNLQTRIAGCCQPRSGDPIVGFITRNYGLSIHRQNCHNITRLDAIERQRLFDAQWAVPKETGH